MLLISSWVCAQSLERGRPTRDHSLKEVAFSLVASSVTSSSSVRSGVRAHLLSLCVDHHLLRESASLMRIELALMVVQS